MADLTGMYDQNDKPNDDFSPIPEGEYLAKIITSETKETKNRDGKFLELCLEICDGEHTGRKLFDRLNLQNKNEVAVKIARGTLAQIREATGINAPRDSCELHGIPMNIKVVCKKSTYNGEERMQNEIKKYTRRGAAPVAQQGAASEGGVDQHVSNAVDNL